MKMWPECFWVWLRQTPNFSSQKKWCGIKYTSIQVPRGFRSFVFFGQRREIHFSWDFFGGTPRKTYRSKSLPIFPSITWARWKIASFPIKKCFLAPKTNPWWNSYECCIPKNVHTMYILSWYGSSHPSHVGELHSSQRKVPLPRLRTAVVLPIHPLFFNWNVRDSLFFVREKKISKNSGNPSQHRPVQIQEARLHPCNNGRDDMKYPICVYSDVLWITQCFLSFFGV